MGRGASGRCAIIVIFRAAFGGGFIDYYAHIKSAELERFRKEACEQPDVTPWEQKEYLDLF